MSVRLPRALPTDDDDSDYYDSGKVYFSDAMVTQIRSSLYAANSTTTMIINNKEESCSPGSGGLVVNENVPEGYILLPTSYDTTKSTLVSMESMMRKACPRRVIFRISCRTGMNSPSVTVSEMLARTMTRRFSA